MTGQWRLICPGCDRRTFHQEEYDDNGERIVKCVACGSSAPLDNRKQASRRKDPNPDRDEPVPADNGADSDLSRWSR